MNDREQAGRSYPSRSGRKTMAAGIRAGEETWIAGRLLPVTDGGLVLRDASGAVSVSLPTHAGGIGAGDIVDLRGILEGGAFTVLEAILLAAGSPAPAAGSANETLWTLGREPFERRARLRGAVREYFGKEGFLEVETPCMQPSAGQEPHLDPFRTRVNTRAGEKDAFLITSPEYCHKRLLAAGCEKIFEMARVFRNGPEEGGGLHWYEFTMLEWYRAFACYEEIMADVENLVAFCSRADESARSSKSPAAPRLEPPFLRLTVADAFSELAGIDLDPYLAGQGDRFAVDAARSGRFGLDPGDPADTRFFKILINGVERSLANLGAVFLIDYPASQAALSKIKEDDRALCERFEFYVDGVELANGFTELNDPIEQAKRFEEEAAVKEATGRQPVPRDSAFLEALELGMPPAGGVALGLDRLAMVLSGEKDIGRILPFSSRQWD